MDDEQKQNSFESFLEGVFEACSKARVDKNCSLWYDLLVIATANLSTEMNEAELNYYKKLKAELYDSVFASYRELSLVDVVSIPKDIEVRLFDWEIKLRRVRRDAGLQHKVLENKKRFT